MVVKIINLLCLLNVAVFGFNFDKKLKNDAYFDVLVDRFEETFNDNTLVDFSGIKVRKINKTRSFVGEVIFKQPIGNDIMLDAVAYVKQGNEYRLMPYRVTPKGFCEFCAEDKYVYPDLSKDSDFPVVSAENCPLDAKTYKLNGVVFRLENAPSTVAKSGDYAGEISLRSKSDEKLLAQFRVYVTVHNI